MILEVVPYERIACRKLFNPEVPACRPVRGWNALFSWLRLLLDVDVRVHALQAVILVRLRPRFPRRDFHLLPGVE
jgi:hypothetical protein